MNRKQLGIIFGVLALLILIYAIGRLGNPGASRPLSGGIPTDEAVDSLHGSLRRGRLGAALHAQGRGHARPGGRDPGRLALTPGPDARD